MSNSNCKASVLLSRIPWYDSKIHSTFPIVNKVGNVGIFVQLLMEINCKQLRASSISKQICICHSDLKYDRSNIGFQKTYQFYYVKTRKLQQPETGNLCDSLMPILCACETPNYCFNPLRLFIKNQPSMIMGPRLCIVQGLFVAFACVGSGDPVRVLRLLHNEYTRYNWSIYC